MNDIELKAYEKSDGCMSCGWKSGHWELDVFEKTGKVLPDGREEYWHPCTNQDYPEDAQSHRGYFIYF